MPRSATAPSSAADGEAVLELKQVAHLLSLPGSGSETFLEEVTALASRDLPPDIARLHALIARRQAGEVAKLAHRMAGSAGNLGATALRAHLRDLEQAGQSADWAAADRIQPKIEPEWQRVRLALEKFNRGVST